ncbi:MAG: transcription-repair coupling factor [Candidatus Aminicenantia bacterium]
MELFPENFLNSIKSISENGRITGLTPSSKCALIPYLFREKKGILLITSRKTSPDKYIKNIEFFLKFKNIEQKVLFLPEPFYDPFTPDSIFTDNIFKRINFYRNFKESESLIVIANPKSLLKPLISKKYLHELFINLKIDMEMEREELKRKLMLFGYQLVDYVSFKGEMAIRGGIVDFFPPSEIYPVRVEIIDNKIESLRYFDPSNQRSIKTIDVVQISTLIEYPPSLEFIEKLIEKSKKLFDNIPEWEEKESFLRRGIPFEELNYVSIFSNEYFVSFEKFFKNFLIIVDEPDILRKEIEETRKEWEEIYIRESKKRIAIPSLDFFSFDSLEKSTKKEIQLKELPSEDSIFIDVRRNVSYVSRVYEFFEDVKREINKGSTVFVVLSSDYLINRISEELEALKVPHFHVKGFSQIRPKIVNILKGEIEEGFYIPSEGLFIYTEREIAGEKGRIVKKLIHQPFTSTFRDLKTGDFIVHEFHGIGIFKGLKKLKIQEQYVELLEIEYRNGDRLYITPERMNEIHKYSGGGKPELDKLGGVTWEKTKGRIKKSLRDMAGELLNLYALRKSIKGYAFSKDTPWQREFEDEFPFEETEDQERATEEVKKDMEAESPMDRLICGDVGYGKTEVAIRAAFKAVMDGKQVAVLCPTTLLTIQHLNTFKNRFSKYPVRIEGLTRLTSPKKREEIINDLKRGLIDIIIGTHRLLSSDIGFKDLGLLIIDEEQRFGVEQKEKLKKIKASVDVLTMTATPIPRTLYMSLAGVRDMSIIKTPPKDRLAVQCFVVPFSRDVIRDAIKKELEREGQVYFVHNRIEDIYKLSNFIKDIVPEARVEVIHGRMKGNTIENAMLKFINRDSDVLLTTTIIENGIDIPLVNTLIVNRADTFGLAQLYQLKGRVGRSHRQAFAYFLIPPENSLSEDALKRLKALREFADLGSSFRLALMDLEIRGAGNLLGPQQHGHIQAVGFDYYIKLLEETVRELKGEYIEEKPIEIQLGFDITIPEDYISDFSERLFYYKKISSINESKEIERILNEAKDRFGKPPQQFLNILKYGEIKLLAKNKSIISLKRKDSSLTINFAEKPSVDTDKIVSLFSRYKGTLGENSIVLNLKRRDEREILDEIVELLNAI